MLTYTKPEINLLDQAARLIQILGKIGPQYLDGVPPFYGDPAYDLDD